MTQPNINGLAKQRNIEKTQNKNNSYHLDLHNLNALDVILLIFLGFFCVNYISSLGLFSTICIALFALIPAKIASGKGKKFIRWYCYGFYNFFLASIFILLLVASQSKPSFKNQETETDSAEKVYLLLLKDLDLPIEQLQTNLSQTALAEFRKLQARVSVGISCNDFPAVLAPAKLAVQEFERSKDYKLSSIFSDLIIKIMSLYELSHECIRWKAMQYDGFNYPSYGGIGIPTNTEFGKLLEKEFPTLPKKYVGFGCYCYEFEHTTSYIWLKAAEYSNLLDNVLTDSRS